MRHDTLSEEDLKNVGAPSQQAGLRAAVVRAPLLRAGGCGVLVPFANAQAIAGNVIRLLRGPHPALPVPRGLQEALEHRGDPVRPQAAAEAASIVAVGCVRPAPKHDMQDHRLEPGIVHPVDLLLRVSLLLQKGANGRRDGVNERDHIAQGDDRGCIHVIRFCSSCCGGAVARPLPGSRATIGRSPVRKCRESIAQNAREPLLDSC